MNYCYDQGLPHSEFLARWQPEDRAKLAAVAMEKAAQCQMCGTSAHEWNEDVDAYVAVHMTCPGCMRREIMQDDGDPKAKGTSVKLLPRRTAERLAEDMARKKAEGTLRPSRRRGLS